MPEATSFPPLPFPQSVQAHLRATLKRHGKKLWWMHSAYALALGISVIVFAQRGFEHARMLAVTIGAAWLLVVLFFRVFRAPKALASERSGTPQGFGFYAMTYALKNLYQGMLFFLVPFYYKATTLDSANVGFAVLLAGCALLSTIDIVFDRVLMRFRILASLFHGLTLFACLNLVVPALFPETRTLAALLAATMLAVISFFTLHVRGAWLRKPAIVVLLAGFFFASIAGAYMGRRFLPPVPMHITHAAVGPAIRADGQLTMEVTSLDRASLQRLVAITDVVLPAGKGDRLSHVWRQNGEEVWRNLEQTTPVPGAQGGVRIRSVLSRIPKDAVGSWSVDVETDDGQLVGRTRFRVVP
jgi:uncharacterized membrane protein YobD (UPF0266 family)